MKLNEIQKHYLEMSLRMIALGAACIAFGLVVWYLSKEINYNLSYEDQVVKTICNTVKHEYLQNPLECKK